MTSTARWYWVKADTLLLVANSEYQSPILNIRPNQQLYMVDEYYIHPNYVSRHLFQISIQQSITKNRHRCYKALIFDRSAYASQG